VQEFAGIPWKFGPKIMLEPSFAITFKEIKDKIAASTKFSSRSSIVLGGNAQEEKKEDFIVDGTLIAREKVNFFDHFTEDVITFEPVQAGDAEIY
jgi:hypothetical protein